MSSALDVQEGGIVDGIHARYIKGYENLYFVDITGRVYSCGGKSNHKDVIILKGSIDKDGYNVVILHNNKHKKTYRVCRLIASTFIENPLNLPVVNHIDEDKSNDYVDNLEWTDVYGNWLHSNKEKEIAVVQLTKDWDFVAQYKSIMEASRCTGIGQGNITNCLKGRCVTVGGFRWDIA